MNDSPLQSDTARPAARSDAFQQVVVLEAAEPAGIRRAGEPVTTGVPLPGGRYRPNTGWRLRTDRGDPVPCQTVPLATWPDGTVRWLELSFLADLDPHETGRYELFASEAETPGSPRAIVTDRAGDDLLLETDGVRCIFPASGRMLLRELKWLGAPVLAKRAVRLIARRADGRRLEGRVESIHLDESGPVYARMRYSGRFDRGLALRFFGHLTLYANGLLRLEITLHNPRRARHAGGYWELGDPGSLLLKEAALALHLARGFDRLQWRVSPEAAAEEAPCEAWSLHQASSGGEHWNAATHIDRSGRVPLSRRGYELTYPGTGLQGERAAPTLAIGDGRRVLHVGLPEFWQKFPSTVACDGGKLRIGLLPGEFPALHELQAGEQTTRVVWLRAGESQAATAAAATDLAWCHAPLQAVRSAAWTAGSGTIPWLPSPAGTPRAELQTLLSEALDGPRSFFAKRERIDEYGWRNYGELWADHETAHHNPRQRPIVSHYNNQYDPLHGMLVQWLLSGDRRWWLLADPLARHLLDIDIYHTDRDKPAYSGGPFWHTDHYFEAGRATHRSMARSMRDGDRIAPGGGPGTGHAYAAGLALYYYLSGDRRAYEAVVGLADWVLATDDGTRHLLGLASSQPTGWATAGGGIAEHGPGRGSGNAISVLLEGWLLSGQEHYRTAAERLIRRTIHPADDIAARNLLDTERNWSYTVHLAALARYLELARRFPVDAETAAYARAALLHYARWMAEHERPCLDHPEELVYPTETWAAQDLRKANVLLLAARHAAGGEADTWRAAAARLHEAAWRELMARPSRNFTRPLALVLQQGCVETFLQSPAGREPVAPAGPPAETDFGEPENFVPQKLDIQRKFRRPAGWPAIAGCLLRPDRWRNAWRQLWLAELFRRD